MFDPEGTTRALRDREYTTARAAWASRYRWHYHVTATFARRVSLENGQDLVRAWLHDLETRARSPVSAMIGYARGPQGDLVHAHLALRIAALDHAHVVQRGLWRGILRRSWPHGDIHVASYDSRRRGVRYSLGGQALEWDLVGRPRRRARRKPRKEANADARP